MDKGSVVESTAGHDKGMLFFVLKQEDGIVFIVNGRQRKLESPKRKNVAHLRMLSHPLRVTDTFPQSNKELRRALAAFKEV